MIVCILLSSGAFTWITVLEVYFGHLVGKGKMVILVRIILIISENPYVTKLLV